MPNHVVNEVIFRNITPEQCAAILAAVVNAKGKIDFQLLVPLPPNAWLGGISAKHETTFGVNSLDWCRVHWGTKWNAYRQMPIEDGPSGLRLVFDTAWRPPYGWLAALLNKFGLPFEHRWLSEGEELGHLGQFKPDDGNWGPQWTEEEADDATHRHLHKLRWGVEEFPDDDQDA